AAATRSGSAATTPSGGTSSCPPPWPGCCHREAAPCLAELGGPAMRERSNGPRGARPRIVIIGAGYAGYHCARGLERRRPAAAADIVIVSPTDYMPYLSLLPEVGAGIVDPRHIAVSLSATLRRARLVPGHAVGADLVSGSLTVAGPDGE